MVTGYPKTITSNLTGRINNTWTIPFTQTLGIYTINATDQTYPNLKNKTTINLVIQNASADSSAYSSGDTVTITGTYWDRNSSVSIDIKNSTGQSTAGYPKVISSTITGTILDTWTAQPGSDFGAETYNMTVWQTGLPSENATDSFDVTRTATVNTDKAVYRYNETVGITGSFYAPSNNVWINIRNLDNGANAIEYPKLLSSTSGGNITDSWYLKDYCEGNFVVETVDQTYPSTLKANQTFTLAYQDLNSVTCSDEWGFNCGLWPAASEPDNTFDNCPSSVGGAGDEHVNEATVNASVVSLGTTVEISCEFDPYSTGTEEYIYHYDGSTWTQLYSGNGPSGAVHTVSRTATLNTLGTHWFRCIADWDGENDECADVGSYYDNDDVNVTVVSLPASCAEMDYLKPNVTNVLPQGTTYEYLATVPISAKVVDNTNISSVLAQITYPNATKQNITLSDPDVNTFYNNTFSSTAQLGRYNITILANDTWRNKNYTSKGYFIIGDNLPPVWSNNQTTPISPVSYDPTRVYYFNVTYTDNFGLSNVWIEHNFTGSMLTYQMTGNNSDNYYYNYTDIPVGGYVWRAHANDTSGNTNYTRWFTYTVTAGQSAMNLTFDGAEGNITREVKSSVQIIANLTKPVGERVVLYQDGIVIKNVTSPNIQTQSYPALGTYNITAKYVGSQNYAATAKSYFIKVQDTLSPNVTIIKPASGTKFNTTQTVNISAEVKDNLAISKVLANITSLTGSQLYQMNGTLMRQYLFSGTAGRYNVTVIANDTSGNKNDTEKTYFILLGTPQIITNTPTYIRNNTVLITAKGFNLGDTVTIDLYNSTGQTLLGYPKALVTNLTGKVNDTWQVPINAPLGTYYLNATDSFGRKAIGSFEVVTAVVEADKTIYEQGEIVNITGYNWDSSVDVTLNITSESGTLVYGPLNLTSNASGYIADTWTIDYNQTTHNYTISAYQPSNPNKNGYTIFEVTKRPVGVAVDSNWYREGKTVAISGYGFAPGNTVTLRIDNSTGQSVSGYPKSIVANSQGNITNTWDIPIGQKAGNYTINATDQTYTNLNNHTNAQIVSQEITTDSSAYSIGETVYVSGTYWDKSSQVTLVLRNESGAIQIGYPKNVTASSNGAVTDSWIAESSKPFGTQNFELFARQANNQSVNSTKNFAVTKDSTLITDKGQYDQNETVTITGTSYSANGGVSINIICQETQQEAPTYPKIITSNAQGEIYHQWNTTDACQGNYTVFAVDQTYPDQLNANYTFKIIYASWNKSLVSANAMTLTGNYNVNGGTVVQSQTSDDSRHYIGGVDSATRVNAYINYTFDIGSIDATKITDLTFILEYCHSGDQSGLSCNNIYPHEGTTNGNQNIQIWNFNTHTWNTIGNLIVNETSDSERTQKTNITTGLSNYVNSGNVSVRYEFDFTQTGTLDDILLVDYSALNVTFYDPVNRSCTILDSTGPTINLESFPLNKSGDIDGNVTITYNVSDATGLSNCSVILNGEVNQSVPTPAVNTTNQFNLVNLPVNGYDWSIECYDSSSELNRNVTPTNRFEVIYATKFTQTTDFSVLDVSNIPNLAIIDSLGKINYTQSINLRNGSDLNTAVNISNNYIDVDSVSEPRLNKSAILTLYNLPYKTKPIILKNTAFCTNCKVLSYDINTGTFVFNVTSFSSYKAGSNSNLSIWDDTDIEAGNKTRYAGEQMKFYANYTNSTSGVAITGATCELSNNNTGSWSSWQTMTYNSSSNLYEYNATFNNNGTYYFNVSCHNTNGYENLTVMDSFEVAQGIDLKVNEIKFSSPLATETRNVTIFVNVSNELARSSGQFSLELNVSSWQGSWIHNETQTMVVNNISGGESDWFNFTWYSKLGTYQFNAYADSQDSVSESDETNNNLSANYTVSAWTILYGDYEYRYSLADSAGQPLKQWNISTLSGNILFSDVDSIYNPSNLKPLNGTNDLTEADTALGMTYFNDSISKLFDTNGNNIPDNYANIVISGSMVENIPIVNTVSGSPFITGILWDSADGGLEYDGSQDLVIVTTLNSSLVGAYGTYDYEVRVPSRLKKLKGSSDYIARLDEVT